jgi:hypothetical protein
VDRIREGGQGPGPQEGMCLSSLCNVGMHIAYFKLILFVIAILD